MSRRDAGSADYAIVDPNEVSDHYAANDEVCGEFRRLTDSLGCDFWEASPDAEQ